MKYIRHFFRLQKENKVIKDRVLPDLRNIFEHEEEETYYKPVKVSKFSSNNYIEFESKGDRNKTLSVEEYFNKIRLCLKGI